jgi:uncharacterized protein YggE
MDQKTTGKEQLFRTGALLLLTLSALIVVMIFTQVRTYKYIGQNPTSEATITVSGDAEGFAKPDIAEISYSVEFLGKTPKEAKDEVAKKTEALTAFVKGSGVDAKDIRTTNYSLYPEYDWIQERVAPCTINYCPPQPAGKQVLKGYRITESYEIKLRGDNFDKAGDVIGGLADKGATNVSGLTFKVDGEEKILEGVRSEAIAEARAKAEKLAKELGVDIVRVQSYNEGVNYPMFNARGGAEMKLMAADAGPAVNIQPGQEKLSTSVTITYVVR